MMDAVEFLKELQRRSKNNPNYYGEELNIAYIEPVSLVAQVEEWAKEHPVKTRQSEFLKIFPNTRIEGGAVSICPLKLDIKRHVHNTDNTCIYVHDCEFCINCKRDFWLQEVE